MSMIKLRNEMRKEKIMETVIKSNRLKETLIDLDEFLFE